MFPEKEIREWAAASGISYKGALREIARFYEEDFGRKEPKQPLAQVEGYIASDSPDIGSPWLDFGTFAPMMLDVSKEEDFVYDKKVRITIEDIND